MDARVLGFTSFGPSKSRRGSSILPELSSAIKADLEKVLARQKVSTAVFVPGEYVLMDKFTVNEYYQLKQLTKKYDEERARVSAGRFSWKNGGTIAEVGPLEVHVEYQPLFRTFGTVSV